MRLNFNTECCDKVYSMKRVALYSKRRNANLAHGVSQTVETDKPDIPSKSLSQLGVRLLSSKSTVLFLMGLCLGLSSWIALSIFQVPPQVLTQEDIDAAVMHTLQIKDLPSRTAKAAELIRQSVVRVSGFGVDPKDPKSGEKETGVGSGVVVMEDGTILTNLHVVNSSTRLVVTFFDGFESVAHVVGIKPDKDLAIIKPERLPDDLVPAVLGSTQNILPGDEVVAVGFPFGMGPSVTSGVISGLNREFQAEGKKIISGLIQFDAAANPGNSGGPLVNMAGEVVGIITAILNPSGARTFIGIGFATTIEEAGLAVGIPPF